MRRLAILVALCGCGRHGFAPTLDGGSGSDGADATPPAPGVITLAGGDVGGFVDGTGSTAQFANPVNLVVAPDGMIYVADRTNAAIRTVTPDGVVGTLVSGIPEVATPFALDFANDTLIVGTDMGRITEVNPVTGAVLPRASGLAGQIRGITRLADGRIVYTAWASDVVSVLDTAGATTTLAGNGTAGATNGPGASASFDNPTDILQHAGGFVVADIMNHRMRAIALDGTVTTYAGSTQGRTDGTFSTALFDRPAALAHTADGTLYVADRGSKLIRRIATDGTVTTIAGNGVAGFADADDPLQASFNGMEGIDVSPDERFLYIADGTAGVGGTFHRIRRLTLP